VENMQGVFYYCQALKTLKLSSNFVTTSAKYDMSNMFFNCKALTSLDLSSFVISSDVTDMHGMFYGCSNLETIFCVDDANWYNSNIDQRNMFDGCVKLKGKCGGREPFACDGSTNIEGDYARVCTPTQDGYFTSITERKGDANGDGEVNSGDVMAIYSVMAGNGTPEMQARADVNGDGHVDSGDIMAIYNIMAGN
jgi:surface protein